MPASVTLGDYLRPSVFTKAARIEKDEICKKLGIEEFDDNDEWVKDFEARYTDVTRMKPKAKDRQPAVMKRRGTPARVEARELAPLEVVYPEGTELRATEAEAPRYRKVKVALDSGAGAHVINAQDAPGYAVKPSAMSQSGAAFLAADGGRIQNYGEVQVRMLSDDSKGEAHPIVSRFEAADVTRALWSVSLICDAGLKVDFDSNRAMVSDQRGNEICVFQRSNGLYVAEVDVENPESFHRPGQ